MAFDTLHQVYELADQEYYTGHSYLKWLDYWYVKKSYQNYVRAKEKAKTGLSYLELMERAWLNKFCHLTAMYFYESEYQHQLSLVEGKLNAKKFAAVERKTQETMERLEFDIAMLLTL